MTKFKEVWNSDQRCFAFSLKMRSTYLLCYFFLHELQSFWPSIAPSWTFSLQCYGWLECFPLDMPLSLSNQACFLLQTFWPFTLKSMDFRWLESLRYLTTQNKTPIYWFKYLFFSLFTLLIFTKLFLYFKFNFFSLFIFTFAIKTIF